MKKRIKSCPSRTGWSLMEAVVAMAIGFFLMVGTAEMLVLALRLQDRARSIIQATDMARDRLEALRAETAAASPTFPPSLSDGETTITGRNGRTYSINWTKALPLPPLINTEVRVVPTGKPEHSLVVALFLHPLLGF